MKRFSRLAVWCSLAFAGNSLAETPVVQFHIAEDCECRAQVIQAASYWVEKLDVIIREVPEAKYAKVVFTDTRLFGHPNVVVLNEKQISDSYWMTQIIGREVLGVKSVESGISHYGENQRKIEQKTERDPLNPDAPPHIKQILKWMDEVKP